MGIREGLLLREYVDTADDKIAQAKLQSQLYGAQAQYQQAHAGLIKQQMAQAEQKQQLMQAIGQRFAGPGPAASGLTPGAGEPGTAGPGQRFFQQSQQTPGPPSDAVTGPGVIAPPAGPAPAALGALPSPAAEITSLPPPGGQPAGGATQGTPPVDMTPDEQMLKAYISALMRAGLTKDAAELSQLLGKFVSDRQAAQKNNALKNAGQVEMYYNVLESSGTLDPRTAQSLRRRKAAYLLEAGSPAEAEKVLQGDIHVTPAGASLRRTYPGMAQAEDLYTNPNRPLVVGPNADLVQPGQPGTTPAPAGQAPGQAPGAVTDLHRHAVAEARRYGLDPVRVLSMFTQESRFDNTRTGRAGEIGISQFLPATADSRKLDKARLASDGLYNVSEGVRYLAELTKASGGNLQQGLVKYNGGGDPEYIQHTLMWDPQSRQILAQVDQPGPAPTPTAGATVVHSNPKGTPTRDVYQETQDRNRALGGVGRDAPAPTQADLARQAEQQRLDARAGTAGATAADVAAQVAQARASVEEQRIYLRTLLRERAQLDAQGGEAGTTLVDLRRKIAAAEAAMQVSVAEETALLKTQGANKGAAGVPVTSPPVSDAQLAAGKQQAVQNVEAGKEGATKTDVQRAATMGESLPQGTQDDLKILQGLKRNLTAIRDQFTVDDVNKAVGLFRRPRAAFDSLMKDVQKASGGDKRMAELLALVNAAFTQTSAAIFGKTFTGGEQANAQRFIITGKEWNATDFWAKLNFLLRDTDAKLAEMTTLATSTRQDLKDRARDQKPGAATPTPTTGPTPRQETPEDIEGRIRQQMGLPPAQR